MRLTIKASSVLVAVATVAATISPAAKASDFVSLGGPATGYLSVSSFKNSTTQNGIEGKDANGDFDPNHNGLPDYPNFEIPTGFPSAGIWTAVIASPLSASADYSPVSTEFYGSTPLTISNQVVSQPDASTLSAGHIEYDNSAVPSVGSATIGVADLTFDFNTFEWDGVVDAEPRSNFNASYAPIDISPLSPVYTEFNDGSGAGNAQLFYLVSIDNVTGSGLTFQDGDLVSMDITGDVTVSLNVAPFFGFASIDYVGTFTASGLDYSFDVKGTGSAGPFSNVNLLMNRAGTASVVPEPGALALAAAVSCMALVFRRRG